MLKIAIVGLGTVSQVHLGVIQSFEEQGRVKLVAGCDVDPEKKGKLPQDVPFYTDLSEMLKEAKPDAVHSCLPHDLHSRLGRKILASGAHLLTEKPLAHNLEAAQEFVDDAKHYPDQVAAVCFQNRLNPCSVALKQRLLEGQDGPIRRVRAHVYWERDQNYYAASPWRGKIHHAGGGTLINQAIHTLDLMQYMVGSPPESLRAITTQLREPSSDIDVEDTAVANMLFPGGVRGFYCSTNVAGANDPIELIVECEKATYFIWGTRLFRQAEGETECLCIAEDEIKGGQKFYYGMSHGLMIKAFYDAIEGKADAPIVTLEEGLASMKMIDAIFRSSLSGQRVTLE